MTTAEPLMGEVGTIAGRTVRIDKLRPPRPSPYGGFTLLPTGQTITLGPCVLHVVDGPGSVAHFYAPFGAAITGPAFYATTPPAWFRKYPLNDRITRRNADNRMVTWGLRLIPFLSSLVLIGIGVDRDIMAFTITGSVMAIIGPLMIWPTPMAPVNDDLIEEQQHPIRFPGITRDKPSDTSSDGGAIYPYGFGCGSESGGSSGGDGGDGGDGGGDGGGGGGD